MESKIPKGVYCYTYENGKQVNCPYWKLLKNRPEQENGWCDYLNMGDTEIIAQKDWDLVKEDGERVAGFGFSFLWDQCKMCGINDDWGEDE